MILAGSVLIIGLLIAYFVVRTRWYKAGLALFNAGDYDGAIAIFSRIIKYYPQDANALKNRALIRQYKGDYANARLDFDRAVARGGRISIDLQIDRAYFLIYNGDYAEALASFERALHSDPSAIRAQLGKVQANILLKAYATALASAEAGIAELSAQKEKHEKFKAYMKYEPAHTGALFSKFMHSFETLACVALGHLGRGDEALQRYDRIIAENPDEPSLYNDRAETHFLLGDYASALADYQTLQEKFPANTESFTFSRHPIDNMFKAGLAVAFYAVGDMAQAQNIWRELRDYSPHYNDAKWVQKEFFWNDAMTSQAEKLIASLQEVSHA